MPSQPAYSPLALDPPLELGTQLTRDIAPMAVAWTGATIPLCNYVQALVEPARCEDAAETPAPISNIPPDQASNTFLVRSGPSIPRLVTLLAPCRVC